MARTPARTALALAYLVPFTAVVGTLILLGVVVDRLPWPGRASRRYEGFLFALVDGLGRPLDGAARWPSDRVAPGTAGRPGR